jgi:FAD/FMN-containing dehydrogenase
MSETMARRKVAAEPSASALSALQAAAGSDGWTDEADICAAATHDWRGHAQGHTPIVLQPRSVEAVQRIVRAAVDHRIGLTPQGGNTGLVAGGIAAGPPSVILSLTRLNRIRSIDPDDFSLVAEAGCILADVQAAAQDVDRMFPLALGAQGTARIGGLISTNAGGVNVLRYGTVRALVLGLEAVLPDGALFQGLSPLRKDNTGYDVKQLLIGAEGTLGVITAATLKLFPAPKASATAWATLADPEHAVRLLGQLKTALSDQVSAFELMPRAGVDLVIARIPNTRDPLPSAAPWRVLIEATSPRADEPLTERLEAALAAALEAGLALDAVVAASSAQANAIWKLRETLPEAEKQTGLGLHHDVSVPIARMPAFLKEATAACLAAVPGASVMAFGHLGDGNIHFNLRQPPDLDGKSWRAEWGEAAARLVYDLVKHYDGSISAEHGVGLAKKAEFLRLVDPGKLSVIRAVKQALDPHGVMNPGVILDS